MLVIVYPPVKVVCVVGAVEPIEKGVTFHALVVDDVVVISDFIDYRYFVHFAVKRMDMSLYFVGFHLFHLQLYDGDVIVHLPVIFICDVPICISF